MTGSPQPVDPRDTAPQRVLPLVVRVERADPPTRTDALEAAAIAVLTLLTDPRSHPAADHPAADHPAADHPAADHPAADHPGADLAAADPAASAMGVPADHPGPGGASAVPPAGAGEWAAAVREWADARIGKVVRRARGAEWRRAAALDGITVAHRTAEVRVFPPVPLDGWPRDLARLQVSGTDLADPAEPPPPRPGVPVLWLNPHLELTAGKAMAQVGHAAQLGWEALDQADRERWQDGGFDLAVRTASRARWPHLLRAGLPLVREAGFTEIAAGTCTAVADHPALRPQRSRSPGG
ncbi:MAG: peptidyl-tRNA hydrolase [Mycobacteriales bacterium]